MKNNLGKIVAIANQKGGVSKSVSTANLACTWGRQGKKVLIVDADYQGNVSSQLGMKEQAEDLDKTISNGLLIDDKSADTVWLKTKFENVSIVAATQEFSEFNMQYMEPGAHGALKFWLEPAKASFDIIIVDTHPSLDLTFQNVMVAADYYLLPLSAEPESLEGLHVMLKNVKKIKDKLNPSLDILGCFVSKFDSSIKTHQRFLKSIEELGDKVGMKLLGVIPFSKGIPASSEAETPIVIHGRSNLPIVTSYQDLADTIEPMLHQTKRGRPSPTPQISKQQIKDLKKNVRQSNGIYQIEDEVRI